jgi:outer membrane biogenesis lipoprotein LolB
VKNSLTFLLCLAVILLTGCAVTEQSAEDVGYQFQEGLQGRGQIVPNNPTSDSFGPMYQ